VSKKKIIYLQGQQNQSSKEVNYEPLIQNDDLLSITISSVEPELAAPFNIEQLQSATGVSTTSSLTKSTYLVDTVGEIDFPVLGKIKVSGYTKTYLKQYLKERLALYLTEPIINIRILNYKVSVLGEVNKPGNFTFSGDRVTLLEAIANAGDLTLYGKRDNILIVRDYLGTKTYNRVDITKADFVNSPFYYLDQNDVVYVEPRKARIDGTAIGGNITAIMSIASFLITTTILLTR
jgi:polysaccharide export outer membrane protein